MELSSFTTIPRFLECHVKTHKENHTWPAPSRNTAAPAKARSPLTQGRSAYFGGWQGAHSFIAGWHPALALSRKSVSTYTKLEERAPKWRNSPFPLSPCSYVLMLENKLMSILSKKQYIFFLRGALPHHRAGGDSQEGRGSTCAPHTGHASWRSGVAGPGAVTRCSPRSSPGRGRCPPARSPGGQPDRALSPPSTLNVSQPVTGWFACMKSKPPTVYFLTRQARDLAGGGTS